MEQSKFKELIVWQKSMDLVDDVYAIQRRFPKSEVFGLGDQMRRAVVSIPSNIAEGYGARQGFVSDIASVESRDIDVARILNSLTPTP